MKNFKIGLLKETKTPPDKRAALTPSTALELQKRFPHIEIKIQSSELRAFKDQEYIDAGFEIVDDLSDCDFLLGVKSLLLSQTNLTCFFLTWQKNKNTIKNFFKQL